jgi:hypothetical protein
MRKTWRLVAAALTVGALVSSQGVATPIESRNAAVFGADHLVAIQNGDGSFPWDVTDPTAYQNVQGLTAIGLDDAFLVSLDAKYLDAATKTRDWLAAYRSSEDPPKLLSAPNIFFLAQHALLTLKIEDLALARAALQDRFDQFGGPAALADFIIQARSDEGNGNLGLWDVALFARAAQDVGWTAEADEIGVQLATTTIVDPFDAGANWYELGLTGLILGLSETDYLSNIEIITKAETALEGTQLDNGAFPLTYAGESVPDVQTTAYAVLALASIARTRAPTTIPAWRVSPVLAGADSLVAAQAQDGGWVQDGFETAETDSEAVSALVAATLLVPNGVVAYADAAKALL